MHVLGIVNQVSGTEKNRSWGPLLPPSDWHDILIQSGFSGVDLLFHDYGDAHARLNNVMVSQPAPLPESRLPFPISSILVSGNSHMQYAIARTIQNTLREAGSKECDIVDLERLSSSAMERRFFISLLEVEHPFLHGITAQDFERLQKLLTSAAGVLWVNQSDAKGRENPTSGMVIGLFRSIRNERTTRLITLGLQDLTDTARLAQHITKVLMNTFSQSKEHYETEYEERQGRLCINRVTEATYLNKSLTRSSTQRPTQQRFGKNDRALALRVSSPGILDTLEFTDDPKARSLFRNTEVEINVKAVGVNFKDVLTALGRLPEGDLGLECAGVVTQASPDVHVVPGDRVCVTALGTYKTYVRTQAMKVHRIPDGISFAEASAFPVVYCTAYQALYEYARIQPGESILIHSGAGGTGQAAIQLAMLRGAEIFVTVGSDEKRKLLTDSYAIPEDHIFASRGLSFTKGVKRMTGGRGVDVILNSLSDESLQGSWECLADFGRFVEIGMNDILKGSKVSMRPFARNCTFMAVNLVHMLEQRPAVIEKTMQSIIALAEDGSIGAPRPLHMYIRHRSLRRRSGIFKEARILERR